MTDHAELVKRLDTKWMNGPITRDWDSWRGYIAKGGGASWPRDAFEGYIETRDEEAAEAARAIEALVKERDAAHAIGFREGVDKAEPFGFAAGREAGIREAAALWDEQDDAVEYGYLKRRILALLDKPA